MPPKLPCLVVASGPDTGARLIIDRDALLIGRGREADLPLTDRSISRQHLHVGRAPAGAVRIVSCQGVRPFFLRDREATDAEACVGDRIVLGNSVLLVAEIEATVQHGRDSVPGVGVTTDIHSLLSGLAHDVRGFGVVYALNESLTAATDRAGIEAALAAWGPKHAESDLVALVAENDQPIGDVVFERANAEGQIVLSVPAHGEEPMRVVFHTRLTADRVSDSLRELLVVAGAICASSLARVRANELMDRDRDSLRQLAIGSARGFLGTSPAAIELAKLLPKLAAADAMVMLLGETGVGKSFVARVIHESGPRAAHPFRVINCAAIPENLLESELFGHERGAFSGAVASREGAFQAVGAGTLLLDEIGELPMPMQAKLLRVLEERRFERIGSNKTIPVRARVLVATNRDLAEMVTGGSFRQDLFFRLSVITVRVPPLRERSDDIADLARRILADLSPTTGRRIDGFSPSAIELIRNFAWPGNVRELRNCIEHAIVLGEQRLIEPSDLPPTLHARVQPQTDDALTLKLPASLEVVEQRAIEAALLACKGNRTRAAVLLGINRQTLYNKLDAPRRPPPL